MEHNKRRSIYFKLGILWLAILVLSSFWATLRTASDPVSITVMPQVPRQGEPIIASFKLNNSSDHSLVTNYQFYANGQLLKEGVTTIAPESSKAYKYDYENPLDLGEQLNFVVKTQSEQGQFEKTISLPSYPPHVWLSFVSFASFSTSVMDSISTMTYYQTTFTSDAGVNVGLIISIVLIVLMLFAELTQPVLANKRVATLGRLRVRLSAVTWILFIIFMGFVYTQVIIILAT